MIYSESELMDLLCQVLYFVASVQMKACIHNTLFRGGIAVGRFFDYDDVLVSEALVKAHNVESTIGIPSVGIDESVKREFSSDAWKILKDNEYILDYEKSPDCVVEFLNFFSILDANPLLLSNKLILFEPLRKTILENYSNARDKLNDKKIIEKYKWLISFYNENCTKYDVPAKYLINEAM